MRQIYHVTTEYAGVSKVGGLADMVFGLCSALHQDPAFSVRVILPHVRSIQSSCVYVGETPSFLFEGKQQTASIYKSEHEGIEIFFIGKTSPHVYRDEIYGYTDDPVRFLYFCAAVIAWVKQFPAALFHLHDWPTAAIATEIQSIHRTVLTIHNALYQGRLPVELLSITSMNPSHFTIPNQPTHQISLLAGGIRFAHHVTTVSKTYAEEICTPQYGAGLEHLFRTTPVEGIVNGIDYNYWNPATDPLLPIRYTQQTAPQAKELIKLKVLTDLGLKKQPGPLFCVIGRLTYQKSPEAIIAIAELCTEYHGNIVILGSPDRDEKDRFDTLHKKIFPSGYCYLGYNESLAHMLYAGSDFIVIPSRFEPCGLTQLIGMRYGSIPIVTRVGGLKDTVDRSKGLLFDGINYSDLQKTIATAFSLSSEDLHKWQQHVISIESNWEHPATRYNGYTYNLNKIDAADPYDVDIFYARNMVYTETPISDKTRARVLAQH